MIKAYIPNNFLPERSYAVQTLLTGYCGVEVDIIPRGNTPHYELIWEGRSIIIMDDFFGKMTDESGYTDPVLMPSKITQATSAGLDGILLLYGVENLEISPDKIVCHADLFAGAFFLWTRWEESISPFRDQHGRFPASKSLLVREGYILRPVIDEYAALMRKWLTTLGYPVPEKRKAFSIVPTCDVDLPFYWQSRPLWKILGGRFRRHWNPVRSVADFKEYLRVKKGLETDPYDTFDYLMTLAESKGLHFQFNFIGGGETSFEGHYNVDDAPIINLIKTIQERGHEIGLHPSYNSWNSSALIASQKEAVSSVAGVEIMKSRQHYLRFGVPETWRHLQEAGIKEDSTLGYAAEPGFRCGTCHPFPVFDIHRREILDLIEHPLLIMDVSLRMYKNLSIEQSIALCRKIKEQVIQHQGEFVILWHNSSLSRINGWQGWHEVLEDLVVDNQTSENANTAVQV